jgi:hypothetical protein
MHYFDSRRRDSDGGAQMMKIAVLATTTLFGLTFSDAQSGEVVLGPELKIPPHYKPGASGCRPGRGYTFTPQAAGFPANYPKMNLRVFNGEVIGFVFELDAKEGWRPWYDQSEGKPTEHDGSIKHYTQTIYIKKAPTAEECQVSSAGR